MLYVRGAQINFGLRRLAATFIPWNDGLSRLGKNHRSKSGGKPSLSIHYRTGIPPTHHGLDHAMRPSSCVMRT